MRHWSKTSSKTLAETRIFNLQKNRVENPRTGGEIDVFVLTCPDWVNVIALTDDSRAILVKQYRHGVEKVTLEIPGGMVDPGENPKDAAVRELLEETGFSPKSVVNLGFVDAQPAFQNNRCHTFLALGCQEVAEQDLDHGEDLAVELVPLIAIEDMILEGIISHALVVAAFYRYRLWREAADGAES